MSLKMKTTIKRTSALLTALCLLGVGGSLLLSRKGHTAMSTIMYLDQKITTERDGTGSVVVLVPGLHRGRHEYDQVKATLKNTHDVITFDLLGQGESSCPDINYNAYTQVEVLGELIKSANLTGKFHLVGFGEGATIAAHYAAANPTNIKSLALISALDVEDYDAQNMPINVLTAPQTDMMGMPTPGFLYRRLFPPTAVTEAFGALAVVLSSKPTSPMVNPNNAIGLFAQTLTSCYRGGRAQDRNRVNSWFTKTEGAAITTAKIPTALIFGDGDHVIDAAYQAAWKTAISIGTIVTITAGTAPSCGHDLINECPTQAATALNTFFTANGG